MTEIFKKRGRFEIIQEILLVCRKTAKKTNILYKCNLSYNQLQKYLEYIISQNLVTQLVYKDTLLYELTEKGKEFLQEYWQLESLLEEKKSKHIISRNPYGNNHFI